MLVAITAPKPKTKQLLIVTSTSKGVEAARLQQADGPAAKYRPSSGNVWVNQHAIDDMQQVFHLTGKTAALTIGAKSVKTYLQHLESKAPTSPAHAALIPEFTQAIAESPQAITVMRQGSASHDIPFVRHEGVHKCEVNSLGDYGRLVGPTLKPWLQSQPEFRKAARGLMSQGYQNLFESEIAAHLAAGQHESHLGLTDDEAATLTRHYCDAIMGSGKPRGFVRNLFGQAVGAVRRIAQERDPLEGEPPGKQDMIDVRRGTRKGMVVITMRKAYLLSRNPQTGQLEYSDRSKESRLQSRDGARFDNPKVSPQDRIRVVRRDNARQAAISPVGSALAAHGFNSAIPTRYQGEISGQWNDNPLFEHILDTWQPGRQAEAHHTVTADAFSPEHWQDLRATLDRAGLRGMNIRSNGRGAQVEAYDPKTQTRHTIDISPTAIHNTPDPVMRRFDQATNPGRVGQAYRAAQQAAQQARHAVDLSQYETEAKQLDKTHEPAGEFTDPARAWSAAGQTGTVYQPDPKVSSYRAYRAKPVGQQVAPPAPAPPVPKPVIRATGGTWPPMPSATMPAPPPIAPTSIPDPVETDEDAAQLDARQQRRENRRAKFHPAPTDIQFNQSSPGEAGQGLAQQLPKRAPMKPAAPNLNPDEEDPFADQP